MSDSAETSAPGGRPTASERVVTESLTVERRGRFRFPVHRIVTDTGGLVAETGWRSWLTIYFGRGQRIRLADGTRWKLTSIEYGGALCPVVADTSNKRVAMANPGTEDVAGTRSSTHYALTGADWGYTLSAAEAAMGRPRRWVLVEHEIEMAVVTSRPNRIEPNGPVPLGAALLSLLLARFGMPADADLGAPRFRWD
jgi:hypothetical protein